MYSRITYGQVVKLSAYKLWGLGFESYFQYVFDRAPAVGLYSKIAQLRELSTVSDPVDGKAPNLACQGSYDIGRPPLSCESDHVRRLGGIGCSP